MVRPRTADAEGAALPAISPAVLPRLELLTSSGTSGGERKLIPVMDDDHDCHH